MQVLLPFIYIVLLPLLIALLWANKVGSRIGIWITKPTLSGLFILVAILQTSGWADFHLLMLTGFVFCFLGDVFLIPASSRLFMCGLVSFLTGHLFYIAAFCQFVFIEMFLILPALVIVVIDAFVLVWLRKYIQQVRGPVWSYILVISVMVLAGCAVLNNDVLDLSGRMLLLGGAISFFVSDLFVVRERFVSSSFINPLLGLPLYYCGQFALAISLGFLV